MSPEALAFWAGFGTCLAMVTFVVLSAVRMAGLCSQEERLGGQRPDPDIIRLDDRRGFTQPPRHGRGA